MSVPPHHPPGFFLSLWLFLVKSFTGLFKSDPTSSPLPPPVTAHHRATPVFKWLSLQRSTGFACQSQVLTATETHEDFVQPCSSNNCDPSEVDLGTKTYNMPGFPGFIGGTVSPRVPEDGIIRVQTSFNTFVHPSDIERRDCIVSATSGITDSDLASSSQLLYRRVSLGAVSMCRSPTGSILSVSPVKRRLLGILPSINTPVSPSELIHNVGTSPLAVRRDFSGGSVRMSDFTIHLESPWSPLNKTLPLDVWVNPKGIIVNAHGPLCAAYPSPAEDVALQYVPRTDLWRAPSSLFIADEEDSVSLYSHMVDLAEQGYAGESSKRTSVFSIVSPDTYSPPSGVVAISTTTSSIFIEANPHVLTHISTFDSTQDSAEDVELNEVAQHHISSEVDDDLPSVVSESIIDIASDDQTPGLAYIPSLGHTGRPLPAAVEPLFRTDRVTKCFSVPYLSSVREPDHSPLRASTSSSSKSFPEAVEDRNSRALADLISLLDLAALQTAETIGVSEIRMGNYLVRAA